MYPEDKAVMCSRERDPLIPLGVREIPPRSIIVLLDTPLSAGNKEMELLGGL